MITYECESFEECEADMAAFRIIQYLRKTTRRRIASVSNPIIHPSDQTVYMYNLSRR